MARVETTHQVGDYGEGETKARRATRAPRGSLRKPHSEVGHVEARKLMESWPRTHAESKAW